jgi:hypothetical protein
MRLYLAGMERWRRFEAYVTVRTGWSVTRVRLVVGGLGLFFLWMMLPGGGSRSDPALWGSTGELAPNGAVRTSDYEAGRVYRACMRMDGDPAFHQTIVSRMTTPQGACSCAARQTWQNDGGATSEPEGYYQPVSDAHVIDAVLFNMRECL